MIPKNIIQTYKTYDTIPYKYKQFIIKIRELHPDYNYMFYSDDDIDKFMKSEYSILLPFYNNLKYNIQRFDLFRLLVIYKYGGFYFDIDVEIVKPVDDLLDNNVIFPVEFPKNIIESFFGKSRRHSYVILDDQLGQYAFASEPHNLFIKAYITNIIKHRIPLSNIPSNNKQEYVCCTTGPRILTTTYYEYGNKDDILLLKHSNNMRFGDYGIHYCANSWV